MGFVVVLVLCAIIWLFKAAVGTASTSQSGYKALLSRGLPARGILLAVTNVPSSTLGVGLFKLQVRQVRIDIEVPGRAPYEVTASVAIPLNLVRDVLPGAIVELRIDRKNPTNIAIVGPGVGFNAATLMTQGQINQGAA
ncbi:hypothetical protein BH11MYX1_BH11MYX1_49170 [soil metagenome]